jgi:hypothetical protein
MKTLFTATTMLALMALTSSAQAELRHVELRTLGMD